MINLNDAKFENKQFVIFNDGKAGVATNCTVRFEKKTRDDADGAPEYKLFVTDENGGEINIAFFGNFDNMSEKGLDYFVRNMKHLATVFKVDLPAQVASYKELLDTTIKLCKEASEGIKVNIAVAYGKGDNKKKYLEPEGFWSLQNVDGQMPRLSANANLERVEPTASPNYDNLSTKSTSGDNDGDGW